MRGCLVIQRIYKLWSYWYSRFAWIQIFSIIFQKSSHSWQVWVGMSSGLWGTFAEWWILPGGHARPLSPRRGHLQSGVQINRETTEFSLQCLATMEVILNLVTADNSPILIPSTVSLHLYTLCECECKRECACVCRIWILDMIFLCMLLLLAGFLTAFTPYRVHISSTLTLIDHLVELCNFLMNGPCCFHPSDPLEGKTRRLKSKPFCLRARGCIAVWFLQHGWLGGKAKGKG